MKIVVTGGSGMVGRSLKKILPNAVYLTSKDYDLTYREGVELMLNQKQPDVVIHLAAKVGGIIDNIKKPVDYFEDNILMNTLLVRLSYRYGVSRFIGILSTCIYPDKVDAYPLKESDLHLGPPTETNFSYGYAKRTLAVQIDAYNNQYGTKYQYLTPCNLYGEFDKYGENSHFIAALIKKIHAAKINDNNKITLFGTGKPLRQFMHADDLSYVINRCIEDDIYDSMNVSVKENLSIDEMAKIALSAMDAENIEIEYDHSRPDGQFRKDVSIELLNNKIGDHKFTDLYFGIKQTYDYLIKHNCLPKS
jgi:GDP-L-fucose synthase